MHVIDHNRYIRKLSQASDGDILHKIALCERSKKLADDS